MRILIIVIIVCFITSFSANAQNDMEKNSGTTNQSAEVAEIERINGEVKKMFRSGKYDEALKLAKQELDLRIKLYGAEGKDVAVAYSNIGSIYRAKDKPNEAITALKQALTISEKNNLGESSQAAVVMSELGFSYSLSNNNTAAEEWFMKAIATAERANKNYTTELYTSVLYAARFYWKIGENNKTADMLLKGIEVSNKVFGKGSEQTSSLWFEYDCLLAQPGGVIADNSAKLRQFRDKYEEPNDESKAVKGGVMNGKAISLPKPAYPSAARNVRASGTVVVRVLINQEGKVVRVCALSGHPLLRGAASAAAMNSRFTPTLLDGKPVKVTGTINYNFER
jgi:TonB family protein